MADDPNESPDVLSIGDDPRYKGRLPNMVRPKGWMGANPNRCGHKKLVTDAMLGTVECEECGANLNPIEVLYKVQRYYSEMEWKYEAVREHNRKERERALREQQKREARRAGGRGIPGKD